MNIAAWKRERIYEWPYCEMAHLFRNCGFKWFTEEVWSGRGKVMAEANHWHHCIGGSRRVNDKGNLLHVNFWIHEWLTPNANVSRVLSCAALRDMGRLDWKLLSEIRGANWPAEFECDKYVSVCRKIPFVEDIRRTLIKQAA